MTEETNSGLFGDSRRSFMKKGALTAGAVALGTAGAGTATAQDGGDVLVFADDYHPDVEFSVAAGLNDQTRNELFSEVGLEDEFDTPDDWDVYVINYDLGGAAPSMGFLMTEDVDLSAGDSETMGADGQFRNSELGLIEVTPGAGGGGDNGGAEEEEEEPAAGNETENGGGGAEEEEEPAAGNETENGGGGGGGGGN